MIEVTEEERFRAKLRSRRMYQTALASDLATAEDRGIRRGIEIGMRKSIEIGEHNKSVEIARNLLGQMPDEKIANATGLTIEEVARLHSDGHQ